MPNLSQLGWNALESVDKNKVWQSQAFSRDNDMSLRERITNRPDVAMKARDATRLSTLRMVKSSTAKS